MSDFILPEALVREIELALENSQIAQDALSEALPQEIQAKLMQAQKELFEDQSGQREEWVSFLVQNWKVLMHELQSIGNDRMVAYFAQDPPSEDINANQRLRYIAAANGLYVGLMEFRRVHWSTKEAVLAMNGMKMLCDTEDPTQKLWHDEAYCMFIEWAKATIQPVVTTQDQPMTGIAMEIPGGAQYASSIQPQVQQQLEMAATQDQRMTGSVMQIPGGAQYASGTQPQAQAQQQTGFTATQDQRTGSAMQVSEGAQHNFGTQLQAQQPVGIAPTQGQLMTGVSMQVPVGAQYGSGTQPQVQQPAGFTATQDQRMTGSAMQAWVGAQHDSGTQPRTQQPVQLIMGAKRGTNNQSGAQTPARQTGGSVPRTMDEINQIRARMQRPRQAIPTMGAPGALQQLATARNGANAGVRRFPTVPQGTAIDGFAATVGAVGLRKSPSAMLIEEAAKNRFEAQVQAQIQKQYEMLAKTQRVTRSLSKVQTQAAQAKTDTQQHGSSLSKVKKAPLTKSKVEVRGPQIMDSVMDHIARKDDLLKAQKTTQIQARSEVQPRAQTQAQIQAQIQVQPQPQPQVQAHVLAPTQHPAISVGPDSETPSSSRITPCVSEGNPDTWHVAGPDMPAKRPTYKFSGGHGHGVPSYLARGQGLEAESFARWLFGAVLASRELHELATMEMTHVVGEIIDAGDDWDLKHAGKSSSACCVPRPRPTLRVYAVARTQRHPIEGALALAENAPNADSYEATVIYLRVRAEILAAAAAASRK